MSMEERVKKLEEKWKEEEANQEKSETESLEDAFFGMEQLIYASRSIRVQGNSNVTVVEIEDTEKK